MITISLCMIVKNEEQVLRRCLESAKSFADEIILVDTGSTDKTKEIGKTYGGKIFDFPWRDDFAAARNEAFSKATMDYCMWLDADDVVTEENQNKLKLLKSTLDKDTDIVMMKYAISEDQNQNPLFSYYRERLIRNKAGYLWEGRVHEAITPMGNVIHADIVIVHRKVSPSDPDRNLKIYEKMLAEGQTLTGRNLFYYGRELLAHKKFQEAAQTFLDFLKGYGWVENKIEACYNLAECFQNLKQEEEEVSALLQSFLYAPPRGEACFKLGRYFQDRQRWQEAIFWYESALRTTPPLESGGFIRWDYYGYLPEINLCVCYDHIGNREKAYEYHLKSKARKPEAEAVKWNMRYFEGIPMDEPNLFAEHMIQ